MLQTALLSLVPTILALIPALAVQVPLGPANGRQVERYRLSNEEWGLDKLPNPNDTDHLVFETVHSLLQHWPNTRMRNGHNIVPGIIPKGTLLYHGRTTEELPPGPEWVALDPEHSYVFCRSLQDCWQLTLATVRSLKVIYFDGSSAVKLPNGSMDTQDLIAWGVSDDHRSWDEKHRIRDLCKWGKNLGVDGFVRMEMSFEVMLCNFTSGVSVVSFSNLIGRWPIPPTMSDYVFFEVMNAGSWHNHPPGETRVQLDLAGLVSFYDVQLVPSLIGIRVNQERWDHRVQNISTSDLSAVKLRLETILVASEDRSSGVDWRALVHVIVERYAGRLELTHYLLNSSITDLNILDLADKVQTQLTIMLTPYRLLSTSPTDQLDKNNLDWTIPIYKLCATTHVHFIESNLESMTDSEKLLLRAVRGTNREICRVVTKMWAAGVYAGVDTWLNTKDSPDVSEVTQLWNTWREDLDGLMRWLDWNVWVKCNPGCGAEEMCWLPTWPIGFPRRDRGPGRTPPTPPGPDRPPRERPTGFDSRAMITERFAERVWHFVEPGPDDWIRPQPRCVRRFGPYDL